MTAEQEARAAVALDVLRRFRHHDSIYDGAMDFFGTARDLRADHPFCIPELMKQEIVQATLKAEVWKHGLAGHTRLQLARQLGPRDPAIVEDVAQVAFNTYLMSDIAYKDTRSEARSVLASFGEAARPWKDQALAAMSDRDALGTAAAQVAAASKDPQAVAAVARLLSQSLEAERRSTIRRPRASRVVELAYGLGAAGEAARPQDPPFRQRSTRHKGGAR